MYEFDKVVRGSIDIASSKAMDMKNTQIEPIHFLYGLLENPLSFSYKGLRAYEDKILKKLSELPTSTSINEKDLRPSSKFSSWITKASAYSTKNSMKEIGEKSFLRFLPDFFSDLNIDFEKFNEEDSDTEVPKFLINLNEKALNGKLDPVIGRSKEIRSVMEILGRRSKNNPVLVGPPGVGKTAIVEGLAEAIVKGKVPDVLKSKTIFTMDLGSLMAGTKFRGEFEERIQELLNFAKKGAGEYIVFIDEVHQLIGAGKTEGAMDAANLLKPALSRGELHCVGATTDDEFQKYILNDPALERRFRKVPVWAPTKEDSIEILMGLKDKFEAHHGVKITDEAISSAVYLSDQYITDKNLPDKAIDLIDESGSALKLSAEAMPANLEELASQIRNKKILAQVEKNEELETEVKELQKDFDEKIEKWEAEVASLKKASILTAKLEKMKFDLEKAEREQNYEEASKLKYSIIPELEKELEQSPHEWKLEKKHVANVISRQTGIPLEKILKSRQEGLLELEAKLKGRVFGQDQALHEISETLLASYAGLTDETRPLGSFLLKGPTGVGKTETAKALAEFLFDSSENIIRLDMSEYSEKHSISKLIGAPAGYIGHEDGGQLTEAVRRRPYSVILFDEIEKAHFDFSDILLQILDDGRLTDNKGRTVSFKNTVILLTSNTKDLANDFRPEVIGRIDSVLEYNSLGESIMEDLVNKQIKILKDRVNAKKLNLEFDKEVISHLAKVGHDPVYGARPLNSTFNRLVIRPLSKHILKENIENKTIQFKLKGDEIALSIT